MKLRNELRNVCRETPPPKTCEPLRTHKKQAIPNNALTVGKFVVVYAISHAVDPKYRFTTWTEWSASRPGCFNQGRGRGITGIEGRCDPKAVLTFRGEK